MLAEVPEAQEGAYLLEQRYRYTYAAPVRRLRHRLVVVPRATHGGQVRIDHGVSVSGSPVRLSVGSDAFANHVVELLAPSVAEWIEFEAWALVARRGTAGVTVLPTSSLADRRLLAPTPLTRAQGALADAAGALSASGAQGLDLAEQACTWAHRALRYQYGITSVRTTAVEAVAGGLGVCQDYAHIMLALCRALDLPARYVSGHLVGEGGSHAWVEVVVDQSSAIGRRAVAVALDPTHDRRAGGAYLTVAVGRDYADVAPTSGTFEGAGPGVLSASKRLSVVPSDDGAPPPLASLAAARSRIG